MSRLASKKRRSLLAAKSTHARKDAANIGQGNGISCLDWSSCGFSPDKYRKGKGSVSTAELLLLLLLLLDPDLERVDAEEQFGG